MGIHSCLTCLKAVMVTAALALCPISILGQRNSSTYRIKNSVVVTTNRDRLTKLIVILPLPQSCEYQTVKDISDNGGVAVPIPKTDDTYLRWTFSEDLPQPGGEKEIFYECTVTLHPVEIDFSQMTTIHSYDTSSEIYNRYTGKSGIYIDPDNASIRHLGDSIWSVSSDIIDYARKCYRFVSSRYSYLNPYTGIHPLQDILDNGGGDCGNLSSIYISLLRNKNIPSKHIVTIRPDGSLHIWADFYLEQFGWIPVDVTLKLENPEGDFFGNYSGDGIVMTREVNLLMDKGDGTTYYTPLLQRYEWWYWSSTDGSSVTISHKLSSAAVTVALLPPAANFQSSYIRSAGKRKPLVGIHNNVTTNKTCATLVLNLKGQALFHRKTVPETVNNKIAKGWYIVSRE